MRIKSGIAIVIIMSLLCACSGKEAETGQVQQQITAGTTVYEEKEEEGKVVAENDTLILKYQESTANFSVENKKDKSSFTSIGKTPNLPTERSLFEVRFMDAQSNILTMNSFADSVKKGQYKTEYLDNGVKLSFTLGEVAGEVLCPSSMEIERFESFLKKVESDFSRAKLGKYYYIPDVTKMKEEAAKDILQRYPDIAEHPKYILKAKELPASQKKEISEILASAGYTKEDYLLDTKEGETAEISKRPAFDISMYLTLEGDALRARIPMEEIREYNGAKLISIHFLNYFGVPDMGEKGSFLLPDGTGSLMDFYNGKGNLSPAIIPVYGTDRAIPMVERIFDEEEAALPVYGILYENKAMLGVLTEGESFAEIRAWPGDEKSDAYAAPVFNVRQNVKMYLGSTTGGAEAFTMLQQEMYRGNLSVDYYLFDKDSSTLEDMAAVYAKALFGKEREEKSPEIYLEFIGAAYKERNEMSVLPTELVTYTTLSQVREIVEDIRKDNATIPLVVKLSGFGQGGLSEVGMKPFSLYKKCGTNKELGDLLRYGKEQDVEIYLDYDPQYVDIDKPFDGFSKTGNCNTLLTRIKGVVYPYSRPLMIYDDYEKGRYILNNESILKKLNKNVEQTKKLGFSGLSLGEMGRELNSDFRQTGPIERQGSKEMLQEGLAPMAEEMPMITNGANAWILPMMKHVQRIPLERQKLDVADDTVPFFQMVAQGYVGYSDYPVNLSVNSESFIQKSLDSGAGFTYVLTGEKTATFLESEHSEYFSTDYTVWKKDIQEKIRLLETTAGKGGEVNGR